MQGFAFLLFSGVPEEGLQRRDVLFIIAGILLR